MMPDYEAIAASVEGAETIPEEVVLNEAPAKVYRVTDERYQGLAAEKGYDQSEKAARLQSLRYSHEAMIDVILAEPGIKQNKLAEIFDRSVPWISRIIGSDAFQAALAKRREEITDPYLIATVTERMNGVAMQSLDIIAQKLADTQNTDLALKSLDITSKALGFGARAAGPGQTNQFIIQLPPKAQNSEEWVENSMKQIGNSNG